MRKRFLLPALGLAQLAAAAETPDEIIAACREADDANARIACLEAALRGELPGAAVQAADAVLVPPSPDSPTTATVSAPPAADAVTEPAPAESAPIDATSAVDSGPELEQPEPAAGNTADIGREQLEARTMTREEQLASLESARGLEVAAYSEVPYQRIVVHLKNGQVWRQIAGDDQYFRVDLRRNQTVDIQETSIGGYKLRLNEMRRTIRVERIE